MELELELELGRCGPLWVPEAVALAKPSHSSCFYQVEFSLATSQLYQMRQMLTGKRSIRLIRNFTWRDGKTLAPSLLLRITKPPANLEECQMALKSLPS